MRGRPAPPPPIIRVMPTERARFRPLPPWRFAVAIPALLVGVAVPRVAADEPPPQPAAQIQGRVFLQRNDPVVGVTVMLRPQAGGSPIFLTTTDGKGVFRLKNLPDGIYRGELRRDGLKPVVQENYALKAPFRGVYEVQMFPEASPPGSAPGPAPGGVAGPASLRGTVRDRDGSPIVETKVQLTRRDGTSDPRSTVTGKDGGFVVADLQAGSWDVDIEAPGLLPIRIALDLAGDERLAATLVQQPATYAATPEELMPEEEPFPPK